MVEDRSDGLLDCFVVVGGVWDLNRGRTGWIKVYKMREAGRAYLVWLVGNYIPHERLLSETSSYLFFIDQKPHISYK